MKPSGGAAINGKNKILEPKFITAPEYDALCAYICRNCFRFQRFNGVLCNAKAEKIRSDYPVIGEKYYLTSEDGERLGEGTYIGKMTEPMSESDARLVSVLELIPMAAVPVYAALCIIGAALMFYRNKLKRPLEILEAASAKISENDLNFSVEYPAEDELGQLCASFETMRVTLAGNFFGNVASGGRTKAVECSLCPRIADAAYRA